MRPSASFCQSSRYRLLTLLLVLLLGVFCAQTVGDSTPSLFGPNLMNSELSGGEPLTRNYYLAAGCNSYVQITPAKGPQAIHAIGPADRGYEELMFESISPNVIRIRGVKSDKFLCFSRFGRIRARTSDKDGLCQLREVPTGEGIMLQSVAQPSWYVGFGKNGKSKPGFKFPGNYSSSSSSNNNRHLRVRGKKSSRGHDGSSSGRRRRRGRKWRLLRQEQQEKQQQRRQRHRHGSASSLSPAGRAARRQRRHRKGGEIARQRRLRRKWEKKRRCFEFVKTPTDQDSSDLRVQVEMSRMYSPGLRDSDLNRLFEDKPDQR